MRANVRSAGWVLYDGTCGVCTHALGRFERLLARRGFELAAWQDERVQRRVGRIPEGPDLQFGVLLPDGTELLGPAAYRHLLRSVGWARPLYWLTLAPGLRWLFDRCCFAFARRRHAVSKACRLEPGRGRRES
jgi:predicted DCC family thiol-disulfide oxidoreductase YuxK